jgi:hypothetical protein
MTHNVPAVYDATAAQRKPDFMRNKIRLLPLAGIVPKNYTMPDRLTHCIVISSPALLFTSLFPFPVIKYPNASLSGF